MFIVIVCVAYILHVDSLRWVLIQRVHDFVCALESMKTVSTTNGCNNGKLSLVS